jgi:hypothetical protein
MSQVAALIACVSLLYATVGQAGGTAFLAIMAFAAFPADEMRPTALLLNIVAAGYATWRLHRSTPGRNIDVHVSRLRRRIEADPEQPDFIKTVRSEGYLFAAPVTLNSCPG